MTSTLYSLYSVSNDWQILLDRIAEQDGELTDDIVVQIYSLINHGKSKIEDAVLAKRNLEFIAEQAMAQARLFQKEYERCRAIAEKWENAANKIGTAMVPVIEITGNVSTVAGTAFLRRTPSFTFKLKDGAEFFELPSDCWRQKEPELNKAVLRELAKHNMLPEQISVSTSETVSVCLKRPVTKATDASKTPEQTEVAA